MCELFGISSSRPTDAQAVLHAFQKRGGETADNPDGWGIAFLREDRFTLYKEPLAAARSQRFGEHAGSVHTDLLIAHVRKARLPRVNTFANTHPFLHACCGREWVFAHNGLVPEAIALALRDPHRPCTPAGETDSEHAFCHLLGNIAQHFHEPLVNGVAPWLAALGTLSRRISAHGKFNFLISDGIHLIAYGHDRLHYRERRGDGDRDEAWIATEPLTAEAWQPFETGELRIYRRGRLVDRVPTPTATNDYSINAA
ncbi:MAG TPA: class II glutamine amidotransferase [Acidiferrobacterales bacterium]|nr:class II glutamine amidotransferase [Acidiferrobacterales bacterium]